MNKDNVSNKPKAFIKKGIIPEALPESYVPYTPFVPKKSNDKIRTYGNKIEKII